MERMTATNSVEDLILEAVVSDTLGCEASSVEATPTVPMTPRSPRPKQSMVKENKPTAKEKQKKSVQIRATLRKHTATPTQKKINSQQKISRML